MIVDAQNEYDHGLLAVSNVQASRAVIGDVLKRYREVGGDVVGLIFYLNPLSHLSPLFKQDKKKTR